MGASCSGCADPSSNRMKAQLEKQKFLNQVKAKHNGKYDIDELAALLPAPIQFSQSADMEDKHLTSPNSRKFRRVSSLELGATTPIPRVKPDIFSKKYTDAQSQSVPVTNNYRDVSSIHIKDKLLVVGYIKSVPNMVENMQFKMYYLILLYYQMSKQPEMDINSTITQIKILHDETAKAKSLALCNRINEKQSESYSWSKYLEEQLETKTISKLFSKFPDCDKLSPKQFCELLRLTVILYKVKMHQEKTGIQGDAPDLNVGEINKSVEYLLAWCVQTYGRKQRKEIFVCFRDKITGQQINGCYSVYKLAITQMMFSDVYKWVREFGKCNGQYEFD